MHPFLLNTVSGTTLVNSDVYVYMWASPYGWWNQGETFGSSNGLTFMYKVVNLQTGVWGPSKASLASNIWPSNYSQSIVSNDWPGVGADKWSTPYDINWNVAPLNSSTGYIGFTFGSTGHIGYTSVFEIISSHSWIPYQHRVFEPNRHYRAVASRGSGLTNSELIENIPNAFWQPMPTPWIKRKMNFIRKELQNISLLMGNCGFYMSSASLDDEYYIYGDYNGLGTSSGDTRFYNFYMYPGNTSGGFTWFASYTGSSAAPDSLIQRGITSFRAFLLSHGFTTNPNSSKFVDGLTAIRGVALANNIAASGSVWQTLGLEYKAAVADWVALHFQDYIEDFKRYNGLTSENNKIADYGYYRTDVAVQGYTSDRWGATYSGLLKQLSSDFIPYPDATPSSSASNARKSAYYGYNVLSSGNGGGYVQREIVGDLDSIYCYGTISNYLSIWRGTAFVHSLDRGKLIFGNSYGYGLSQGINFQYYWQYPDSALQAPRWYVPANYLNSGLAGQTFTASKCYELFGITASMRYDPTGSLGSTRGNATRCAGNSAPQFISWHLNPVWGITQIGTADNYNPANYLPLIGRQMTLGISCGSISLEQLNITRITKPGATWTKDYFDPSGFPIPGNTLPAGSLYNQYWSHWYPMAFMALMYDVYWGRQVAANNVYRALGQQEGVVPTVPGSVWNYVQKPIETWITDQKISTLGDLATAPSYEATGYTYTLDYNTFVPTGLTFGYFLSSSKGTAVGNTQIVGEQGPMFYEHMRHQYLHKTIRYIDWNIPQYTCTTSATGGQILVGNVGLPFRIGGITSFGVCGAITMALARKVNTVVGECNTRAGGLVNQTVFLAPGNMAERSYLMSGAQKAGGGFLWRITFANPATYPIISVRGSLTGITTEYRVAGITDYINNANSKFGIWWETSALEIPVVENAPIPEARRREIVNLPENPQFEYDAMTMAESRNPIDPYYVNNNIRLVCYIEQSPYGHWNQAEQWGNQNGLTYCWPNCLWPAGYYGPNKAQLALGIIDWANYAFQIGRSDDWIPQGYADGYDVDWRTTPWSSSTGYIGFTFGSTGFLSLPTGASQAAVVTRFINTYSWIPPQHRVMTPNRSMRALGNGALGSYVYVLEKEGGEVCTITMYNSNSGPYQKVFYTPWMKRRANFTRTELRGFYQALKNAGFTMGIFYANDVIGDFAGSIWDFRSIGMTATSGPAIAGSSYFYNVFMYPNNSESGSTWYAKWDGICAAPDSLVAAGMTSFKSYLLARGFTATAGNWRNINGLTALANAGVSGNIAAGGSVLQFFQQEYFATLVDYFSYYLRDFYNDFKEIFGLTADNSRSSIYGFYKNTSGTYNYLEPGWTRPAPYNYLTGPRTKSSTDYPPYPTNPKTDFDQSVTDYYSVLDSFTTQESGKIMKMELPADISSISVYGTANEIANRTNDVVQIDRNLLMRGNTYLFATSGKTYGKYLVGNYGYYVQLARKFQSTNPAMFNFIDAAKWFPPGFLGESLQGTTVGGVWKPGIKVYFQACSEIIGQTGFFRYDPNGTGGSSAANMIKVGSNGSPFYISWHLNPVFGITLSNISDGRASGPANYIPIYGREILYGATYGSRTKVLIRGLTASLSAFGNFDSCGNPYPALDLPAGSFYKHYWTHWYPLAWMIFLGNVKFGRSAAVDNVARASYQRKNPNTAERLSGTQWFGVQKPLITWVPHQKWTSDDEDAANLDSDKRIGQLWVVPNGITYGYTTKSSTQLAKGITFLDAEAGPMYYEAMRHQYLNKTSQFAYWNPFALLSSTTSFTNTTCIQISGFAPRYYPPSTTTPTLANGVTFWGTCGAIAMNLTRKINKVVGECDQLGKGIVYETISLDAINMDNREYLASGAQLVDGSYLWRITFAHPVTQTPIIIRGSVTGVTTAYNVNGVTDYINIPNSKFGVWWSSNYYETPIVENPPVSEAERLNVLNLPANPAFVYDPFTMEQADLIPSTTKDLFYTPNAYSTEGIQTDTVEWFGQRRETIATFQGIPYQGNIGAQPDTKGRPYAFEYNPVNPTTSSPWHNVVYELAIDPYKWGMRGFLMYWPFGSLPSYNYPMRYLDLWDQEYFTSTTDASRSPARIRGFTSAIKNLLEGKLTPSGFSAINEPCNVMIYLMGANGFDECRWGVTSGSTYYPGSMNFWDRCYATAGSTVGANNLYYSYIDRMVEDIVSINRGVTSGKLSVVVDSVAVAANPGTIGLFANLTAPHTRGASYELGDWYFVQKLKDNNIPTYVEARPQKQYSLSFCGITTGPNKTLVPGYCGATAMSLWRNHLSVEYTLWRTNPRFADQEAFLSRFVPDNEVSTVWRWVQNNGPLGASFDPYQVPMTVFTQGASWTINLNTGSTTYLYTPHQALFNLYAASDVYRKQANHFGNTFSGIVYDYFTKGMIIEYSTFSRGSCGNKEVNPTNNTSSLTGYYRINTDNAFEGNRIGYGKQRGFCAASFIADPVSYGTQAGANNSAPGWWQQSGMSFWRQNVKQASFTGFVQMLNDFSSQAVPSGGNSAGWDGNVYPFDSYSKGIIPLSMRLPERTPIYAFAWTWGSEAAGTPIYYVSGITQNWIPSSNDLTNTTVWVNPTPASGFSVYSASSEISGPPGMSAFGVTFTGSGSKFGNQRYTYSNFVTAGITYTFSFYLNVSQGLTQHLNARIGDHFGINLGGSFSPRLEQILPVSGSVTTNNSSYVIQYGFGLTGWTRFAINVTPKINQRLQIASFQVSGNFATAQTKPYYIAGVNFNEGSTPTDFISTNIVPEIEPNQYGNTGQSVIYDGTISSYLNFGASYGLTYIQPLADAYGTLYTKKSWLSPTSKIKWRESQSLKRYVSVMKGLRSGKRGIYPRFMSSPWLWALEDDKFELGATGGLALTFYDNDGNEISRPLCGNTYHGGLWLVNGLCLGKNIWNQVLVDLSSQNAKCDYFIHNQEVVNSYFSSFEIFDCTGNSMSVRNAIINNPKYNQEFFGLTSWASYMASKGACAYTIQNTVYDPALSYLAWDNYGQALFRKCMDVMVSGYDTYDNGRFNETIQTDAYSFSGDGAINDGAPGIFGFHPVNSMYVMGNAPSPKLYGWYYSGWDTSVIYGTNMDKIKFSTSVAPGETRPSRYPIAWMPFLFDMQSLRLAKRGSPNLPMVPVIPSLRFVGNALILPGQTSSDLIKTFAQGVTAAEPASWYADVKVGFNPQCGITFTQSGGNSAYFYELIRHACLTGVIGFDWWNNSSFWHAQAYGACYGNTFSVMNPPTDYVGYMKTGNTTYLQDMKYLNNVLDDCNTKIGGYSPISYLTNRINYTSNYVISGAPGRTGGAVWRVTVKPGLTLLANGITLSSGIGIIGTWINTPGPTLTGIGFTFI